MAQIFKPSADTWVRLVLVLGAVGLILFAIFWSKIAESAYLTRVGWHVEQPVPFSHQHHVSGLGIDCRYCHVSVETGPEAGFPPTHVCMTCHSQIWTGAEMLAPVRRSYAAGRPITWARVNSVPDFVFFDHSIHVDRGVACVTCHGRVDRMPLTMPAKAFQMEFCLECHRDPAPQLRPPGEMTRMDLPERSAAERQAFAAAAMLRFDLQPARLDQCGICHR